MCSLCVNVNVKKKAKIMKKMKKEACTQNHNYKTSNIKIVKYQYKRILRSTYPHRVGKCNHYKGGGLRAEVYVCGCVCVCVAGGAVVTLLSIRVSAHTKSQGPRAEELV